MKIYLAHPISGMEYDEVVRYYEDMKNLLKGEYGYEVLTPMTAKGYMRTEKSLRAVGDENPVSTNHAIFEHDKWMVNTCDVMLCDLSEKNGFAIGCTMELAWASLLGKHTVLILPDDSPYRHAFMLEAADIVFKTLNEAKEYLKYLITSRTE